MYLEYSKLFQQTDKMQLALKYAKQALGDAREIPYADCSDCYNQLKGLYALEGGGFNVDYPEAEAYIDSIKKQDEVLNTLPFGVHVADLNQPTVSGRDLKTVQQAKNTNPFVYVLLVLFIVVVLALTVFVRNWKVKARGNTESTGLASVNKESSVTYQLPEISPLVNLLPELTSAQKQFDKDINQNILIKRRLYLQVKESQAQAISELTDGKYSVRQVREGFKAVNYESFNDYKFKLRVVDYTEELLKTTLENKTAPDSNQFWFGLG